MRRRDFIKAMTVSAAWPTWSLAARAQQAGKRPIIGFLGTATADEYAHFMLGFHRGLSETGYVEGQNVALESRFAENHVDRLPALSAELIRRQVAVIFATGGATPLFAASAATATIPIVFANGTDPAKFVERGFISSLNRPGGNITGASFVSGTIEGKRLALLHQLVPQALQVAVLIDPDNPDAQTQRQQLLETADRLGINLQFSNTGVGDDFDEIFATIKRQGSGALYIAGSGLFTSRRDQLAALAARFALPTSYTAREFTASGGLMSYGSSLTDGFRQAGVYVGLILKGTKPGNLPIVQPTKFELVLNLKTAKALGLEVPPTLLALADEVIE
jgi:putative tryptophan/tyrosine transport system substrate-binding protein